MVVKEIEWEEINRRFYKGKIDDFEMFFIFKNGIDDYILETCLPIHSKIYTMSSVKNGKSHANRILKCFILSCVSID